MSILPPPSPAAVISTVPPAPTPADSNPYGVSIVPAGFAKGGVLQPGDILAANFNGPSGVQGTGTTPVRVTPSGVVSTFYTSTLIGLATTPVILKSGFVIVGNVPNIDGQGTIGSGALQVLDKNGNLVDTITDSALLKDPWGLAVNDQGNHFQVFVANVGSTTGPNGAALPEGTVSRIDMKIVSGLPAVQDIVQIASGYATRPDAAAFVVGPGGMTYDARTGTLYVASEAEKVHGTPAGTIFAIPDANTTFKDHGEGRAVFANAAYLHGPMGLALAPNGDLITANADSVNVNSADPSELVEFTKSGRFVSQFSVDPANGGAFALSFGVISGTERLAAVDDNMAAVDIWTLPIPSVIMCGNTSGASWNSSLGMPASLEALYSTLYSGGH